jgi:hypothetical protein
LEFALAVIPLEPNAMVDAGHTEKRICTVELATRMMLEHRAFSKDSESWLTGVGKNCGARSDINRIYALQLRGDGSGEPTTRRIFSSENVQVSR